MSIKPGRRNQNRPPRKKAAQPASAITVAYGPWSPPSSDKYISFTREPIHYMAKLVEARRNLSNNTVEAQFVALEDSIHPVKLNFPIPLFEKATHPKGFKFHWEKLTYAFQLADPAQFPPVVINDAVNKLVAVRFIKTCLNLARYNVFNEGGGISFHSSGQKDWRVSAEFPTHQEFTGLSGTFRQLHNPPDEAAYSKVKRIINDAVNAQLQGDDLLRARDLLKTWDDARKVLLKKMLSTVICERVLGDNLREDPRPSMYGAHPDAIIKAFNYGDSLHWGAERENLARLTADEYETSFHKHCCIEAMITLGHFYFGFAIMAAAALGMNVNGSAA